MLLSGGTCKSAESRTDRGRHPLCDGVIVVSANRIGDVFAYPVDAGDRVHAVFDEIAEEQTFVKSFTNGAQGQPVGVDIG